MAFSNRRSLTTQVGLLQLTLGQGQPDLKKIYRMPEEKMKALYGDLKKEARAKGLLVG